MPSPSLTVAEFYCGIGGLHLALSRACPSARVVRAFDWDPSALQVYEHNFPGIAKRADIGQLGTTELDHLADIWLLSPACQPYTVLNPRAQGAADPRARSFLHLIQTVLPSLAHPPQHLLIENVGGFETSSTRQILLDGLAAMGYTTLELLLTPLQFNIPNSRLRYYCLAKHGGAFTGVPPMSSPRVLRHIPGQATEDWVDNLADTAGLDMPALSRYLDSDSVEGHIPDKVLSRWGRLFDIVTPSMHRSCCFTRGYTHLAEGSGSVLQTNTALNYEDVFSEYRRARQSAQDSPASDPIELLHALRLRYFTPQELLRLFYFIPVDASQPNFSFPPSISPKTRYRLIGNSVNVQVVQQLISYMLSP